jgi:hypothetical protein
MMAYRSDRDEDNPPNVEGVEARKAEWDLISGNHQGQRSMTARTDPMRAGEQASWRPPLQAWRILICRKHLLAPISITSRR